MAALLPDKPHTENEISDPRVLTAWNKILSTFIRYPLHSDFKIIKGLLARMTPKDREMAIAQFEQAGIPIDSKVLKQLVQECKAIPASLDKDKENINAANQYLSTITILPSVPFKKEYLQKAKAALPLSASDVHNDFKYMQEFTSLQSVIQYIHQFFVETVFTDQDDLTLKEDVPVTLKKKLRAIQSATPFKPHANIEDLLDTCVQLRNLYTVAEFLRCYIDFHHDFEAHAHSLVTPFKQRFDHILSDIGNQVLFPNKYTNEKITLKKWYDDWIAKLNMPMTGLYGRNVRIVDNHRCSEWLDALVDDLLNLARDPRNVTKAGVVDWIPLNSKDDVLHSIQRVAGPKETVVDMKNPKADMNPDMNPDIDEEVSDDKYHRDIISEIRAKLNENHVRQCYKDTSFGFYKQFLKKLQNSSDSSTMLNVIMPINKWDGASGNSTKNTILGPPPISTDIKPMAVFGGVAKVSVDDSKLVCTFKPEEKFTIEPIQPLSVNILEKTCGLARTRFGKDKKKENIDRNLAFSHSPYTPTFTIRHISLLKTWTDMVQIRYLSYLNRIGNDRIALCTVDACCKISARMYGIPFVLFSEKMGTKKDLRLYITVHCYDLTAIDQSKDKQRNDRLETLAVVLTRQDELQRYVNKWFDGKQKHLTTIKSYTDDPALFFGITAFDASLQYYHNESKMTWDRLKVLSYETDHPTAENKKHVSQMLKTFPSSLNEWFYNITQAHEIAMRFDETYTPMRNIMQRIKIADFSIETWLSLRKEVNDLITKSSLPTLSDYEQYLYVICIFVVAYMENGNIPKRLERISEFQEKCMRERLTADHSGDFQVQSFVGINTMIDTFLPPVKVRGTHIEKEWEECMCIYKQAKMHDTDYWMIPKKNTELELRVADSMTAYHIILQNKEFAQIMEDTLLIGTILQMMRSPNRNVFTYAKSESLGYTPQERRNAIQRLKARKLPENVLKQYIQNMNQPTSNKEHVYHFNSWEDQFQSTKKRTISMIIDPTFDPITGTNIAKIEENSFRGIVQRTFEYIYQLPECTIETRLNLILSNPSHYTRSIWDTAPMKGERGTRQPTPEPILAKIQEMYPQPIASPIPLPLPMLIKRKKPTNHQNRENPNHMIIQNSTSSNNNSSSKHNETKRRKYNPKKRGGQTKKKHRYAFPRRFSKTYCKKKACHLMGFTERASCRPYKNCYRLLRTSLKKRAKRGTDTA